MLLKACNDLFFKAFYKAKGTTDKVKATADSGHIHYLGVLENALKVFDRSKSKDVSNVPASSATTPSHSASEVAFRNLFHALTIGDSLNPTDIGEQSSDDDGESKQTSAPKKPKPVKKKGKGKKAPKASKTLQKKSEAKELNLLESLIQQNSDDNYYSEEEEEEDLYFMIYCFFKDFNYMRDYIQERWCDYQDGLLSLSAVSLVTNTAFELFQKAEKELLELIPFRTGLRNYYSMAMALFVEVGLEHVDYDKFEVTFGGDDEGTREAIHEESMFLCLPSYWALDGWLKLSPPGKIPTLVDPEPINYDVQGSEAKMQRNRYIFQELIAECALIKSFKRSAGGDGFQYVFYQYFCTLKL